MDGDSPPHSMSYPKKDPGWVVLALGGGGGGGKGSQAGLGELLHVSPGGRGSPISL